MRLITRSRLCQIGVAAAAAVLAASTAQPAAADPTSSLNRPADPVVLTGSQVSSLTGIPPADLVAFTYNSGWVQIPVQVDERAVIDLDVVYNQAPQGATILTYTDAGTYAGADPNAALDNDDEIAFMARDAGGAPASFSEPAGVVPNSGVQVTVTDPLAPSQHGHVFLFRKNTPLDPGAGQQYVDYNFVLMAGTYPADYDLANGPNPEDSDVVTPYYSHHFSDRWASEEMRITIGGSTGADILDRHKALFAPGNCGRSEDTFNDAEGAFIINKSGPVRALRSYIGANSGPLTQRQHVFYERRQDITTYLRVHPIGSIMDFFDYSPAASGMTYANNHNTGGPPIVIDGVPETPVAGQLAWEMVNGAQGGLAIVHQLTTNIALSPTSYYLDDSTPPVTQCTGDAFAYGSSGNWINQAIPCTDPHGGSGCGNILQPTRTLLYTAPGLTVSATQAMAAQVNAPLTASFAPWVGGSGDADGDGVLDGADNCPGTVNAGQENADANFTELGGFGKAYDDLTWPNSDAMGDACETDDDNDGRSDADELSGAGCGGTPRVTDPLVRDSDGDRTLDQAECLLGTNPASATSVPAAIVAPDADSDGMPDALDPNDADIDSDDDAVRDGVEFRYYNSNPLLTNGDADNCGDAREVASINGDTVVNAIDLSQVAQSFGNSASAGYVVYFDTNRDGVINAIDLSFVAQRFGACTP